MCAHHLLLTMTQRKHFRDCTCLRHQPSKQLLCLSTHTNMNAMSHHVNLFAWQEYFNSHLDWLVTFAFSAEASNAMMLFRCLAMNEGVAASGELSSLCSESSCCFSFSLAFLNTAMDISDCRNSPVVQQQRQHHCHDSSYLPPAEHHHMRQGSQTGICLVDVEVDCVHHHSPNMLVDRVRLATIIAASGQLTHPCTECQVAGTLDAPCTRTSSRVRSSSCACRPDVTSFVAEKSTAAFCASCCLQECHIAGGRGCGPKCQHTAHVHSCSHLL